MHKILHTRLSSTSQTVDNDQNRRTEGINEMKSDYVETTTATNDFPDQTPTFARWITEQ